MTTVVFENATIQDVISKASKICPTKGGAFDKAAGLMFEVDAGTQEVTIRATNLDVFYMEVCDAVSIEGESVRWLVHSDIISAFASKLTIGTGKQVSFTQEGGMLVAKTGRTKARMHLIVNPHYPEWDTFDPEGLSPVPRLGDLIELVHWAASKDNMPPMSGISMDGEYIACTDRFKIARAPMKIGSLTRPVTVPTTLTKALSKHMGDVEVGMTDHHLLLMPDDSTQIRAVLFAQTHPDMRKFFAGNEPTVVRFKRSHLVEIIDRAMVMSGRDRLPALRMYLGKEAIAVLMVDEHAGQLGDVIDVPGYCTHPRHQIIFAPRTLLDALNRSPNEDVELYYDESNSLSPVRVEGGSGYQVIIVPRRDLRPIEEGSE